MCLGIPGRVVEITDADNMLGTVDVCGVRRQVNLRCIVDADHPLGSCVGNWVLLHVGFAMSRIDADEARRTLEVLEALGEVQAEMDAMRSARATP